MNNMQFTKEDKEKFVEFLNTIASCAEFKVNTTQLIKYFKTLSYMQQKILPKIEANILEIVKVV
jgi:hypothetical protein